MDLTGLRVLFYRARTKNTRPEDFVTLADVTEYLTFTDRESYLAWAAEWKAQYAQLSQEIRQLKAKRKGADDEARKAQSDAVSAKHDARMLLVLRAWSKKHAGELRSLALAAA